MSNNHEFEQDAPWWKTFFDDSYARLGLEIIETERTRKEVDFIIDALKLQKQERVLDLACGMGRHALELARRGFTGVTGLDVTGQYLQKAREIKNKEDLNVRFLEGDMRSIPFEREFDACYNYFTSFGFFAEERDNLDVIASVAGSLKPGGRFLIETINRDYMAKSFVKQGWFEKDGEFVLKKFDFDLATSTLFSTWIYLKGKHKIEREVRILMYSLHEMVAMLERNGLEFLDAWGSSKKEPLTWEHQRLIVLAEKEK
ncbi:class I SAM-dependent methyltransferase [bacterium]|nr:class I SAM-dependent methyltransferase [bacterium]